MQRALQILMAEDSDNDAELLLEALRRDGYQVTHAVVSSPADMRAALERQSWDVITSDYSMPGFGAETALAIAQECCPDVPFIIVSGEIDLNLGIALIRAGARDYVNKNELIRLGQVVRREVADALVMRERQFAWERLRESEQLFRAIVENVGDLVAMLDPSGKRLYNSPSYRTLFKKSQIKAGSNSFDEVHPEDREHIQAIFRRTVETGKGERAEYRFMPDDGSIRHIESEGRAILDAEGKVSKVIVVSRDITERKKKEAELLEMATTDFLTGLPNRRHFIARLEEELARVQRIGTLRAAVLMLDLDHFKRVNDSFGHATGDKMLCHLATLIRGELRKIDTVGRVGGEEFAVLLAGADPAAAEAFADRLRMKIENSPLAQDKDSIGLTVSIGVSPLLAEDPDANAALIRADQALYRAKDKGRNRVEIAP